MSGLRLSETELAGLRQLVRAGEARRVVRGAGGWSTGDTVLPRSLVRRLIEHGFVYVRHNTCRDIRCYPSLAGKAVVATPPKPKPFRMDPDMADLFNRPRDQGQSPRTT